MSTEHLRTFSASLRCAEPLKDSRFGWCGNAATWFRPGRHLLPDGYYCDWHRAPSDLPLPADPLVRRVAIVAEIDLAGVTLLPRPAQHEAVLRLEAAVAAIGGRLNICSVTSTMVRQAAPARPALTNGVTGKG